MTEGPLQSVYDAIQSAYDEVAGMSPARMYPTHSSLSVRARRSKLDEVPVPKRSMQPTMLGLDLRDLEYIESDSHLSCPICHITFIDPVYMDCGHHFCAECLAAYWKTARKIGNRKPCPACRSLVTGSKCAARLIVNMCNDVKVNCPLKACGQTMARSDLESHLASYCSEQQIECEGPDCKEKTKRKYFIQEQCRHKTHMECGCGGLIPNEALKLHKETQCPSKQMDCPHCSQPVSSPNHDTQSCELEKRCPGKEFGCDAVLRRSDAEEHVKNCPMAKMAPHLKALVVNSIAPLQNELLRSQQRVKYLEEGIDRMHESVDTSTKDVKSCHDELGRDINLHSVTGSDSPPTPGPLPSATSSASSTLAAIESAEHLHLLALHEDLRYTVADLGQSLTQLSRTIEEVDARNSMLTVNETLRLKEELALTNNGLYSTRTQVQWLLNRERAGQQPGVRGRYTAPSVSQPQISPSEDIAAVTNGTAAGALPVSNGQTMRPARRTSAGSQERVKL